MNTRACVLWLSALTAFAGPASAEVRAVSDAGFEIASSAEVAASPAAVYAMIVAPGRWWISAHSYSGDARNLTIDARAGGCFCEALPAKAGEPQGSVEHARVVFASPGKLLRLSGALGPLQAEAVTGTLTFALTPTPQGTRIDMSYVVGGYVRSGAKPLAPMVDMVMGQQLAALKKALDAR